MEEKTSNIFPKFVPGDLIDRRFQVIRPLENGILGTSYVVQDGENLKVIRFFDPVSGLGHPSEKILPGVVQYWQTHLESVLVSFESWGKCEGSPYLIRPWVEGVSLAQILAERGQHGATLSEQEQLTWILGLLEAVRTLHHYEVFGTLKPSNIFLTHDCKVVLTDFALMSLIPHAELIGCYLMKNPYFYLAPEFIGGDLVTPQSDIYSMGVILEEILTLTLSTGKGTLSILKGSPWELIVTHCLALEPRDRFPSVEEMEKEIRTILLKESAAPEPILSEVRAPDAISAEIPIPPEGPSSSSHHRLGWGAVLFMGVAVGFSYFAFHGHKKAISAVQIEKKYDLALETSLLSPPIPSYEIPIRESKEPEANELSPVSQALQKEEISSSLSKKGLPLQRVQKETFTSVPICPKEMVLLNRREEKVCMDRYLFPNVSESNPMMAQNFDEAVERCRSVGKEICAEAFWEYACGQGALYPLSGVSEWVADVAGQAQLKQGESCSERAKHFVKDSVALTATFRCCASPFLRLISSREEASPE